MAFEYGSSKFATMVTFEEIIRHHDPDPDEDPWVAGPPKPGPVTITAYDSDWPARYQTLAAQIRDILGATVLHLDHVGSTSVPGLAAKEVIDIDLTVSDPCDETAYVPALTRHGWVHTIREPSFHQHRCFTLPDPRAQLHVFGPDCPETIRHRMFRDWLRTNDDDRARYEQAKQAAIPGGGHVMDYNTRKQEIIREIYGRLFRAAGML